MAAIARVKPRIWRPGLRRDLHFASGLVGYWPIWEGTGNRVMNLVGPDGVNNGATWVTSERGLAMAFDGVDDIVTWPEINLGTVHTFAIRLKDEDSGNRIPVSNNSESSYPIGFISGSWFYKVAGSGNSVSFSFTPSGEYEWLVVTRSGAAVEFYKDGDNIASLTLSGGASVVSLQLGRLGSFFDDSLDWKGEIDQAIAWTRVLSDSEIAFFTTNDYDLITPSSTQIISVGDVAPPTFAGTSNIIGGGIIF